MNSSNKVHDSSNFDELEKERQEQESVVTEQK